MLRALSGLSRQEFFEKIGISASTIDTWESGRVELAQRSAERVCEAFRKVGICCSAEWILTGNGLPPRVMDTLERTVSDSTGCLGTDISNDFCKEVLFRVNHEVPNELPTLVNDDNIRKELCFFLNLNPGALYHIIDKDCFGSRYAMGDCVAGIPKKANELKGKFVIVASEQLKKKEKEDRTFFGRLLDYDEEQQSYCLSTDQNVEIKVQSSRIVGVVWHRAFRSFF